MDIKKLTVGTVAALAVTASTGGAFAAPSAGKPVTGTWTGTTSQTIAIPDPASGEVFESEWSVRMTISVLKGRVVRLYTTIRSVCPGPGVRDHRVAKYWKPGTGFPVSAGGAFTVRLRGTAGTRIEIAGGLFASSGTGRLNVRAAGGCAGEGTWKLKRRH